MPRESSLSSATSVISGSFGQRPAPPADLTEFQAKVWRATVDSEAADFFRTAALRELLADYCRHRETADRLSVAIDEFQMEWLSGEQAEESMKRLDKLTMMRDRETKAASDKATKLRLTNQSRYTPQAAATASQNSHSGKKPWER